jgi:hypothetical protein
MTEQQPAWLTSLLEEATVEYPTTPDLAPAVMAAIRSERADQEPPWGRYGWVVALVAAAVMVLVAAVSIRDSREAIAEFLGLGVVGERIEVLPTEAPEDLPDPRNISDYARPIALADASNLVGFEPLLPGGVAPGGVYYLQYSQVQPEGTFGKPFVVLRYEGYDVWQSTTVGLVGKGLYLGGDTVVEQADIGAEGYWITGGPRLIVVEAPDGSAIAGSERTVEGNTLVWYEGQRYFRIEGGVDLEEALAIARSLE